MKAVFKSLVCVATLLAGGAVFAESPHLIASKASPDPESVFDQPPAKAKPRVMWMWMGSNITKEGITYDLEELKEAGFGGAMMFALADICNPWACPIENGPTPEVLAFTEPWWKLVRHAAAESKRLGLDFGMGNCPGYATSGGLWIKPEHSMQEVVYAGTRVKGPGKISKQLAKAKIDLRGRSFPVINPSTGLQEKPEMKERGTFYRDIAVLAVPEKGTVAMNQIIDLSSQMTADGELVWEAPPGNWAVYRFGYTTRGNVVQPAQWDAQGMECDKMSREAVAFHVNHVLAEVKKHLGEYIGSSFTNLHFDSYEAGIPSWTPKMREEFKARRGYDLTPFLLVMARREVGSAAETAKFQEDFKATISDLYRDVYYPTLRKLINEAGIELSSEPYGGPWKIEEIVPQLDRALTEFWTHPEINVPYRGLGAVERTAWASGINIIEAEAFTGKPALSKWTETPYGIKRECDAAFTGGVNRMMLHHFAQQTWRGTYKPGAVMGVWGTHFSPNQTWWEPGKAWVAYLARCQALLQWGKIVIPNPADFSSDAQILTFGTADKIRKVPPLSAIHRKGENADLYFIANISAEDCSARCSFSVTGRQPELWDPVWNTKRDLTEFEIKDGKTIIPLKFAARQSCFIVFRKPLASKSLEAHPQPNFPGLTLVSELSGPWQVNFDSKWGGPDKPVTFETLQDWTQRPENGIKYYSGTATYAKRFDVPAKDANRDLILDLGVVQHLARVRINGRDLGVVWTAPWQVVMPQSLLKPEGNQLEIEMTNVWANRLIGDEQEPADCEWRVAGTDPANGGSLKKFPEWFLKKQPRPSKGRYCFTTWNYFTKDSPLTPSGLLGPVRIKIADARHE